VRWSIVAGVVAAGCSFRLQAGAGDDAAPITDDATPIDMAPDPMCAQMWSFTASNFDPCAQGGTNHPALTLDAGVYTFTPATGILRKNGADFATLPTTGTSPAVLSLQGLTIGLGASLEIMGSVPLIVSVHGDALIDGSISVSARGVDSGPGGGSCTAPRGGDAAAAPANWTAGGGGAGGAFGSIGAAGGTGDVEPGYSKTPGGAAMPAEGMPLLVPLRGGCRGGAGGEEDPSCTSTGIPGAGGGAGGAIQVTVRDLLTLGATAEIAANGAGGGKGLNGVYVTSSGGHVGVGGGGGGSGGAILLEGASVVLAPLALLCANGGGGGGGSHNNDGPIVDGASGACSMVAAPGGTGNMGNGGAGAVGTTPAVAGDPGARQDDGGGGGGGGVGRIRVRAAVGADPAGFRSTPPALID